MCGFAIAAIMRAVIPSALHPQLRVHARDDDVELGEQLVLLVERAVLEDVDLDAGEDAERRELLVQRVDDVELLAQPLRARGRARSCSRGEWSVSARYSWPSSAAVRAIALDRCAAVGPVGVQVQVAAERGADSAPASSVVGVASASSALEVLGGLARERLRDDLRGAVADARAGPSGCPWREPLELVDGTSRIASGSAPERLAFWRELRTRWSSSSDALQGFDPVPSPDKGTAAHRLVSQAGVHCTLLGGMTEWPKVLAC